MLAFQPRAAFCEAIESRHIGQAAPVAATANQVTVKRIARRITVRIVAVGATARKQRRLVALA